MTLLGVENYQRLLAEVRQDPSLPEKRREQLAVRFGLLENQIRAFFCNRLKNKSSTNKTRRPLLEPAAVKDMQAAFQLNPNPAQQEKLDLAGNLGLNIWTVDRWFARQRKQANIRGRKIARLTEVFSTNAYPSKETMEELAQKLAIPRSKLNGWFAWERSRCGISKSHRLPPKQRQALEMAFNADPMPDEQSKMRLAEGLGLAKSRVDDWFQRQRIRKHKRKRLPADAVASLRELYHKNAYTSSAVQRQLAVKFGLSYAQIREWFSRRRVRDRKMKITKPVARITGNQLKMLSEGYSINPRPDQAMTKYLSEMTGLSARRIQGWFSHRRRRSLIPPVRRSLPYEVQECFRQIAAKVEKPPLWQRLQLAEK